MQKLLLIFLFSVLSQIAHAQIRPSYIHFTPLHLGLTSGIGTGGFRDLAGESNLSFNLISGQSYQNNIFGLTGLSQYTVQNLHGIHISGISHVVGGWPFMKRDAKNGKDSLAFVNAIQVAGLFAMVNGEAKGAQISLLANVVSQEFTGVQITGLFNYVGTSLSGVQLAPGGNYFGGIGVGVQSSILINRGSNLFGAQIPGVLNILTNELDGFQVGLINYVGNRNAQMYRENKVYWFQLGLYNRTFENGDGLQLGIMNMGRNVGFGQIGLLNISTKIPQYPVGLLNIADDMEGFIRFSYSGLYPYNFEFGSVSKKIMNTLGYSFDPADDQWALSYSLGDQVKGGEKKAEYFIEYNLIIRTLFDKPESIGDFDLAYGTRVQAGYNPFLKTRLPWLYFFVGVSANSGQLERRQWEGPLVQSNGEWTSWLDFNFGVQL